MRDERGGGGGETRKTFVPKCKNTKITSTGEKQETAANFLECQTGTTTPLLRRTNHTSLLRHQEPQTQKKGGGWSGLGYATSGA